MSLNEEQIQRYARHILLPDIGGVGQARLLAAAARLRVGPARPASAVALAYLAAAGVGTIVLASDDGDAVSEDEVRSNIVLGVDDVGRDRLEALTRRLTDVNPDVRLVDDVAAPAAALEVHVAEPPDPADLAAALVLGGGAAVRALSALARPA